ncbi:MAG: hypothetical protein LBQ88_06395, partial [Treponema sp.]|nr:hypothetical protein [Treponema sp.]
ENYEYFAENDFDLSFILEAMKGKNYININLQKTTVGSFSINPFMIAENGWIEIEKNIESNNSKKVFVAMWFDDSMNTFFNVCEGYIPRPLAAVLRVCTLSQIPYQNNHTPTALPPPRERVLGLVDYPS